MSLKQKHETLCESVYRHAYFLEEFESTKKLMGPVNTDRQIVEFWHKFWEALPDHPLIHRTPFYEVCGLAEGIFDEDYR